MSKFIGLVSAYAYAKSKGYAGTEEEFAILMAEYASVTETAVEAVRIATESARSAAAASSDVNEAAATVTQQAAQVHDDAETSSQNAATASEAKEMAVGKALDSEAYALGTRDGEDVGSSDETYHNNAKYYAESAATDATTASDAAQTATTKAGEAAQSASAAAESARTLTIDATLTQAGQAADAEVVGDKIGDLKISIDNLENKTLSNLFYSSVIPTISGQSILATYHVFDITIPANTPFTFRINDNDETIGTFSIYWNGSAVSHNCSTNTDYSFTRINETTVISIYCNTVAKTGSVKAVLKVKNSSTNIEDSLAEQEAAFANIETEFDDINSIFNTEFDFQTFSGGYIRANNGEVATNANTGYTDYIDVSGYNEISCHVDYSQTHQMAFYDEDKVYVSGEQISGTAPYVWTLQVPNNARYARLSFYLSVQDSFYVHGTFRDIKKYINDTVDTALNDERSKKLEGKKLGIVGDSISTFQGYIPEGYTTFYPRNTVLNVDQTWWKQLLDATGMELCVNASWSGSTITGDTSITSGYVGCSDARVNALTDGSGNKPDIIIVWMGINDFGKTNGRTCGTYDGTTGVTTDTNITSITDAFGVLLKKLETAYPDARIFVCRILPEQFASEMADSFANGFPNINPNDNVSLPELNDKIEKIANAFGCGVIPMDKCGATFFNVNSYTGDGLHPNALLTSKMYEIAKEALLSVMD